MKQELMRPELDATQFIQFNYWDSGHQGLLSGEALYLDIKRMEMAYHDNNKRELELTRHVSLRQLDPLALLALKITGSCTVTVPEWLYDRDCPGHYMRRIKSVSLSVPSVVGPYTSLNCTLTLQSSTVRVSPLLANGVYARDTTQADNRFVDYFGTTDVIVTSGGSNDSGMFETNLRDERFLPFEGAGAISTWNLSLPAQLRVVRLHDHLRRHPAHPLHRPAGGRPAGAQATKELTAMLDTAGQSSQALLFCLRYDFPTQWSAFVNGNGGFHGHAGQAVLPLLGAECQEADDRQPDPVRGKLAGTRVRDPGCRSSGAIGGTERRYRAGIAQPAADDTVMIRDLPQQVFLVLQYHFGVS